MAGRNKRQQSVADKSDEFLNHFLNSFIRRSPNEQGVYFTFLKPRIQDHNKYQGRVLRSSIRVQESHCQSSIRGDRRSEPPRSDRGQSSR